MADAETQPEAVYETNKQFAARKKRRWLQISHIMCKIRRAGVMPAKRSLVVRVVTNDVLSMYNADFSGKAIGLFDFDRLEAVDDQLESGEIMPLGSRREYLPDESEDEDGMEGEGEWLRVKRGVTLDSGSSVTIMPQKCLPRFRRMESAGSRRKQTWVAANNGLIVNQGQKDISFKTQAGQKQRR